MARQTHVADTVSVGDVFNRWTITGPYRRREDGSAVFPARCECGTEREVLLKALRGTIPSRSCGCLQRETARRLGAKPEVYGDSPATRSDRWVWSTYRLTKPQFEAMLERQDNRCAICGSTFTERPHVDHDHRTSEVRGLLCKLCNLGLGYFKDSTAALEKAIEYLDQTNDGKVHD